jgi:carboxyl-terminal processing protease
MTFGKSATRAVSFAFVFVWLIAAIGQSLAASNSQSSLEASAPTAIQTGVQLERSRKWIDAIEHYQDALKAWPDSKEIEYGLRRSKIHFSIERRHTDQSFETSLLAKSRYDALSLFDDVLEQIRASYVDPISSTSFVAHGTESFYLALSNDKFRNRHLTNAQPQRIAEMRKILREEYWNKPINYAGAARQTVDEVANRAWSLLQIPYTAVVMEYVFGGCNALDDYSNYLTPDRLDDLYGNIEGEFVGLGIEMKAEGSQGLVLLNVLPNSPAAEGGMLRGDYIVGINGKNCREMTTDEAARLLRGPAGSRVRLQVVQASTRQTREAEFVRRQVRVKSISIARIVDQKSGIAYIQMNGFQKSTASELDAALRNLDRQGMRALIWDLRANPGGLLQSAVEVLDRFISGGTLVSTRGRTSGQNMSYSAYRPGTWQLPLVLLVDGDSASASEIVAGAVRDHRRGTIVGRQTYGKWSVQSIFPLRDSTGLRLTTAKFYSPNGHTLGKIGVEPDVVVDTSDQQSTYFRGPIHPSDVDSDADVRKGLNILRSRLSRR